MINGGMRKEAVRTQCKNISHLKDAGPEVLTALVMKNSIFYVVYLK
jgi:hypothetical protein